MADETEKKSRNKQTLSQSILWAAALIGTALILKGSEAADKVMWLLFVLAFTSTMASGGLACERRIWRRLTGKSAK